LDEGNSENVQPNMLNTLIAIVDYNVQFNILNTLITIGDYNVPISIKTRRQ